MCIRDRDGKILQIKDTLVLPNESGVQLVSYKDFEKYKEKGYLLRFYWVDSQVESLCYRSFSFLPVDHKKASKNSVELKLKSLDTISKSIVFELTTKEFLKDVWFTSSKQGVHFNENALDFLPGIYEISVTYKNEAIGEGDVEFFWR